jgi:hypothetical protein
MSHTLIAFVDQKQLGQCKLVYEIKDVFYNYGLPLCIH